MSKTDPIRNDEAENPRDVRPVLDATAILLLAIVAITFLQVLLRYVFGNPLSWGEELSRYIFVWITFLGAAVAFARDTHIRVDALVNAIGLRRRRRIELFRRAVELVAVAVLLYSGTLVAWRYKDVGFYSLPQAPLVFFPLAVPVAAILMAYYALRRFAASRRSTRS